MDVDEFEREFGASWLSRLRAFLQGPRLVRLVLVQRVAAYWRSRALLNKALFRATRRAFRVRVWARDTHSAASLLVQLGRTIAGQVLVAVAVIAIAVGAERLAARYTSFRLPAPASTGGSVRDVLNTIAQIAGIVLTLYYTALSVVISTAYANVATDLRTLIVREKSSYVYVKLLALTCAGSLILLAIDSFGVPVAGLPFLLILATTVLAVLSFVSLGLSAFRFFDPAVLAHQLADDFTVAVRSAASRSHIARQPSFQNYFRQQAADALTTYGEIIAASSRPPHAQHLGLLSIRLAEVLRRYSLGKAMIHPDSLWFARTFKHPRWLMTSDSHIAMALNTGTTLQPTAVADTSWVEDLVATHLLKALTHATELPSGDALHEAASAIRRGAAHLSNAGDVEGALRLSREAHALLLSASPESVPTDREMQWLAAHEELCLASIESVLGFRRFVERLSDAAAVRHSLERLHETGYVVNEPAIFPAQLAPVVRRHIDHLEAESQIEGRRQMPRWYTLQLVSAQLLQHVSSAASALVGEAESYLSRCEPRAGRLRVLMCAQAGQRGLELVSKMEAALDALTAASTALVQLRRTDEESWPALPVELLASRLATSRDQIALRIAQLAATIGTHEDREDRPDYFGFAYTIAADACFRAMARADEIAFKQLFPLFFRSALTILGRLGKATEKFEVESRLLIQAEPILDLLDLSGYAELYTAIEGGKYADVSRAEWDRYFAAHQSPGEALKSLASISTVTSRTLRTAPRDMIRFDWSRRFERFIVERGLARAHFSSSYRKDDLHKKRTHPSALIRSLPVDGLSGLFHARDAFAATYLAARPEAGNVEFGRAADRLRADMQRTP